MGENYSQMWRSAENTFSEQLWTANRCQSSHFGTGLGVKNSSAEKELAADGYVGSQAWTNHIKDGESLHKLRDYWLLKNECTS